jgi:uncharacterized protein
MYLQNFICFSFSLNHTQMFAILALSIMKLLKFLYIVLGTISLCIGIVGIVVPGLPTTPFLLLTAALYIKGSDRLYHILISNKITGPYITNYRSKKGMTLKLKLRSISLMWIMISISCIFFIEPASIKLIVIAAGCIGTVVMGFFVPTV